MLAQRNLLGRVNAAAPAENPFGPKPPHFAPRAKACIFLFMAGAPSQIELFDPKPKLNQLHGQSMPEKGLGFRPGVFATYARNCLLARRLVERGVRFVNIYHASWDHHNGLNAELPVNCQIVDQPRKT